MDLIFVHGALVRDGQWWWEPAASALLERAGIRSRAVELPSCGETSRDRSESGLLADAAALRAALADVDEAILVGHSYGGTVIAEAGHHPAVQHILFITSYLPEVGQSQAAVMSGERDPVSVGDSGGGALSLLGHDESSFGSRFLHDADARTRREAWKRVVPQSAAAFMTPTTAAGWKGVDSTYLVCERDRSTSVELQRRHAQRATRVVDIPTGHHPFLSHPELVIDHVQALISR